MKVVIAGSRDITDYNLVLDAIKSSKFDITEIVCGMARGVDLLGRKYGIENNIPVEKFYADWGKYGLAAGSIRNEQMAIYCNAAIIVWDGKSTGSMNMKYHMVKLKKPYELVNINETPSATLF